MPAARGGGTVRNDAVAASPQAAARVDPRYPVKELKLRRFFCSPETPKDGLKIARNARVSVLFKLMKFLTHM